MGQPSSRVHLRIVFQSIGCQLLLRASLYCDRNFAVYQKLNKDQRIPEISGKDDSPMEGPSLAVSVAGECSG